MTRLNFFEPNQIPRDEMNCLVRFGNCFLRVTLIYQPSCLVPYCQYKLRKLTKTVYYCMRHFVA